MGTQAPSLLSPIERKRVGGEWEGKHIDFFAIEILSPPFPTLSENAPKFTRKETWVCGTVAFLQAYRNSKVSIPSMHALIRAPTQSKNI